MKEEYTFYILKYKLTNVPEWSVLNESCYGDESNFCDIAEPWSSNQDSDSFRETQEVHDKIGFFGWWQIDYAIEAMKRLNFANRMGKFNSVDIHGKIIKKLEYEFKIVIIKQTIEDLKVKHYLKERNQMNISTWQKLQKLNSIHLAANPICEICMKNRSINIVPFGKLQAACASCIDELRLELKEETKDHQSN